jgi:hypothetical protein
MSIDWRFVRADSPDDSAVAPSAPTLLCLQEETGGGGGVYYARDSDDRGGLGGALFQTQCLLTALVKAEVCESCTTYFSTIPLSLRLNAGLNPLVESPVLNP